MTKDEAKTILTESVNNIFKRQGNMTTQELEKEVIYQGCYEILKNRKKKTASSGGDLMSMFGAFSDSAQDIVPVSKAFSEAAMELFPDNYDYSHAIIATEGIKNNIFEDNMWVVLREYFLDKHGRDIDDNLVAEGGGPTFVLNSKRQVENDSTSINDSVEVKIVFVGTHKIIVTVSTDINNVTGTLTSEDDMYNLDYSTDNGDYNFIIRYDKSFHPASFVVINQRDGRTVEYFEN